MLSIPIIGSLAAGPNNAISDVAGVTVGHVTLMQGAIQTGVTVIRPHDGDPFRDKVPAAAVVFNGFGKSIGLVQLQELGVLETPIALTNTLSVGTVATAQIISAIKTNPEIGRADPTLNPLVFECNDGYLNDIQAMAVTTEHYQHALNAAEPIFLQGSVGAGRGMSCFDLKGGIGSASRYANIGGANGQQYCVGALVLANFGKLPELTLAGINIGEQLHQLNLAHPWLPLNDAPEMGSIIMIIATDAPLDARQLRRLATRCGIGLGRAGSNYGHGSGDLALAFSTAQTVSYRPDCATQQWTTLHDSVLDPLFQAVAESTEQAIVNALFAAETVEGRDGHLRRSLRDVAASGDDTTKRN
ncbi:P1 family peptidase [Glaciimonas sp. Gout2]|uniref:DmpA family aminopeptidase n=2 Tax=Glaciimonas TaxID=1229970 RepID=UPI002B222C51|nr:MULTISPECIES: P1 family peptidase [unclassified Glaciimonas]MEB0012453.1 P1 family peptidase [Glaciimonas sp. Cout2]MEB0082618.1 P1 family peptidase [Glaciimonas sp. Gout2]